MKIKLTLTTPEALALQGYTDSVISFAETLVGESFPKKSNWHVLKLKVILALGKTLKIDISENIRLHVNKHKVSIVVFVPAKVTTETLEAYGDLLNEIAVPTATLIRSYTLAFKKFSARLNNIQ